MNILFNSFIRLCTEEILGEARSCPCSRRQINRSQSDMNEFGNNAVSGPLYYFLLRVQPYLPCIFFGYWILHLRAYFTSLKSIYYRFHLSWQIRLIDLAPNLNLSTVAQTRRTSISHASPVPPHATSLSQAVSDVIYQPSQLRMKLHEYRCLDFDEPTTVNFDRDSSNNSNSNNDHLDRRRAKPKPHDVA